MYLQLYASYSEPARLSPIRPIRSWMVICSSSFSSRKLATSRNACVLSLSCGPVLLFWSCSHELRMLLGTEINATHLVVHCICSMQIMNMQNSCLYSICSGITSFMACSKNCVPHFYCLRSLHNCICSIAFSLTPGWPQKKQSVVQVNCLSANLSAGV